VAGVLLSFWRDAEKIDGGVHAQKLEASSSSCGLQPVEVMCFAFFMARQIGRVSDVGSSWRWVSLGAHKVMAMNAVSKYAHGLLRQDRSDSRGALEFVFVCSAENRGDAN
jgi:hypothetical protein